jgi:hypothetical protein
MLIFPIPGFLDMTISEDGRIWRNGKLKSTPVAKNGYRVVVNSVNNKSVTNTVHTLLALTFIGPKPEGHEVLHINGDRLDNRLCNLRYGTRWENMQDSLLHGTATIGTKNTQSKFTKESLAKAREMHLSGTKSIDVAKAFGVSYVTIRRIINGETYTKE